MLGRSQPEGFHGRRRTERAHEAGTVRKATPDEHERLAAVLARALFDDPVMRWAIGGDGRRRSVLEEGFDLYLRKLWLKQDECYTTESAVGAIVWELPGQWKVGILDQLRLLPSMARINGRLLPRSLRTIVALESNHPAAPHYYLPFVGVEPAWQARPLAPHRPRSSSATAPSTKAAPANAPAQSGSSSTVAPITAPTSGVT